ncbi:hypothetical protein C5167_045979 [Papaver somniferum]|uniref:Uncharacterized protein n=1 Tax=Papaver somniferum TaxID=3469 RepID=A0A4Y7LDZ3_PAPSO|nr:hypothetical protein C5167_045979 [Papaver somniferum]
MAMVMKWKMSLFANKIAHLIYCLFSEVAAELETKKLTYVGIDFVFCLVFLH